VNAQNWYGLQVGKVAIRVRDPWNPRVSMGRNIHLFGAARNDDHLSQRLRWAVDDFEVALRKGEPFLRWLSSYHSRSTPGITGLLRRLRALWFLCISVGPALCETPAPEGQLEEELEGELVQVASAVRSLFLELRKSALRHRLVNNKSEALPKGWFV
jgi:hypothetical protein